MGSGLKQVNDLEASKAQEICVSMMLTEKQQERLLIRGFNTTPVVLRGIQGYLGAKMTKLGVSS